MSGIFRQKEPCTSIDVYCNHYSVAVTWAPTHHLRAPPGVANELSTGSESDAGGKEDWHDLALIKCEAEAK
ncbi:hypothetical protein MTO96_051969 [Rhipicephalus appendiculatus]